MPFKKIEVKRKSTYVAEQIMEAIKSGIYRIGDKLPPEREIAEKTGVSRPSVREALAALQIVGIIESRPGDGTYIRNGIGDTHIRSQVLSMLERKESPFEALEARKILEEGVARVAARKATPEDLEEMKKILEMAQEAGEDLDVEKFEKADRDFHLAIVKATNNHLVEIALSPFIDVMREELWKKIKESFLNKERIKKTLDEHRRIFKAIKNKDEELAAKEMVYHLCSSEKRFFEE